MEKNVEKAKSNQQKPVQLVFAIPARLASTRLPEKPLRNLGGTPMIARVAERALHLATSLRNCDSRISQVMVMVATDDERIAQASQAKGVDAVLTDPELKSGTDRIHAALKERSLEPDDLVINIQGDEPFFSLEDTTKLITAMLNEPETPMGTLAFPRTSAEHFFRSSVVKVLINQQHHALYFTRAPSPWPRKILGASGTEWINGINLSGEVPPFLHHLGVYAFRWKALQTFSQSLPPSSLENLEGLEQLRALEAGWRILVEEATESPFGIDTPEDLALAEKMISSNKGNLP
jgi:3-deoxy-manno-octulosonate cytidylyltransferase (CMP-KDO synthetase)